MLNFFAIFLKFSITRRVGTKQIETTIFIFSLSLRFPTYFVLKRSHNGVFNFLNFFAIFLEFSITRRVGTERNDNFYFFSFSAFSNLFLAWNEAIMVYFNFFNFFSFVFEFSITRRVGTERNDDFYFPPFSALSNLFWLEKNTERYFLIF